MVIFQVFINVTTEVNAREHGQDFIKLYWIFIFQPIVFAAFTDGLYLFHLTFQLAIFRGYTNVMVKSFKIEA